MKRLVSLFLALTLVLAAAVPALAAAPLVEKTEYEGRGYVEVDFKGTVTYKNVKVTVKDAAGTKYTARITERDDDDLTFYAPKLKAGVRYTYTIRGVRAGRSGGYTTVKGSFTVPGKSLWIKEIEYDPGDRELEVEFSGKVQYKDLKVTVKDGDGRRYSCKVVHKDRDEVEVRVTGLRAGKQYTVSVQGVRLKGTGAYGTVSGVFRAGRR